ncbi:hsp70 family chaperone [Rhypophila sp. PSN 637]
MKTKHGKHSASSAGPSSRPSHPTGEVLVIGIDFGTTYVSFNIQYLVRIMLTLVSKHIRFSGVSYATTTSYKKNEVTCIRQWPGSGRNECKVPTEICWREGHGAVWGYQISDEEPRLKLFKLLLLNHEDLGSEMQTSSFLAETQMYLDEAGMTANDAVTGYIQLLWHHIKDVLRRDLGERLLSRLPFHIVVTVPAIWKHSARQRMEDAVRATEIMDLQPGVGSTFLELVPEPEAAALATLLGRQQSTRKHDLYVVCDAGGGTVDLITYAIEAVGPIRMSEAVGGTGGLCGGSFVDQNFEWICQERLGPRWDTLSKAGYNEVMRLKWEYNIKRKFGGNSGNEFRGYPLSLPTEIAIDFHDSDDLTEEPHIIGGNIMFKEYHIQQAFAGCLDQIWSLVRAQIESAWEASSKRPVTGVILVGGLGASPHLYNFLHGKLAGWNVEVIQPPGERAACAANLDTSYSFGRPRVDHGFHFRQSAIAYGAPIRVTSTISRISVGKLVMRDWDETRHDQQDLRWHKYKGRWRAVNQIKWYLRKVSLSNILLLVSLFRTTALIGSLLPTKGDRIDPRRPVWHSFSRLLPMEWDGQWQTAMYQCEDDNPPSRVTSTVKPLCNVYWSLKDRIAISRIPNYTTAQKTTMKRVHFKVGMIPTGGSVNFEATVNGIRLGMQNLSIRAFTLQGDYEQMYADFNSLTIEGDRNVENSVYYEGEVYEGGFYERGFYG